MSDAPAVAASPSSRARLVVASQGLEIQHLQEQLSRKDREHHSAVNAILEEKATVEAQLAQQQGRSQRLETQVQLLGERLRELEAREDVLVTGDANMHAELSKANKARDEMLAQLRDEVRALRIQNTSLMQEREVISERLGAEKRRMAQLESEVAMSRPSSSAASPLATRKQFAAYSIEPVDVGTQTTDASAFSSVEEVLLYVAKSEPHPEAEVEALKRIVDLELNLDVYHRNVAAQHATNAAVAQDALMQKVEAEVMRLAAEQERFRSMVTGGGAHRPPAAFGNASVASTSAFQTPAPAQRYAAAPQQQVPQQPQQALSTARAMLQSPISAPDVSPSTVMSGPSHYTPHHGQHNGTLQPPALSNFVVQQHEELAALRSRLSQLQQRHEEVRGVKAWGTTPSSATANVSPPRPDFGSYGGGAAAASSSTTFGRPMAGFGGARGDSPQPDEYSATAYRTGVPMPTPLGVQASYLVTSPAPPPPAAAASGSSSRQQLSKAAAANETARLAAPSSVLDRMLRKSQHL